MKKLTKSERTREFIIEKTAGIFNTKGYAGTSLTDLTEATRLTKGSIYGNFENKEEVALAVFDHNYGKVRSMLQAEMEQKRTWKEKLLVYTEVYDNFQRHSFTPGGCPVLNTAIEADDTHPALRKKAISALAAWKQNIEQLINKGIEAGEFKPGTDAESMAIMMIASIEGVIMMSNLTGKVNYRKTVMQAITRMIDDISI